jgi:hypothetical protein
VLHIYMTLVAQGLVTQLNQERRNKYSYIKISTKS